MLQLFYLYPEAALQKDGNGLVPAVYIKRKRSKIYNWLSRKFVHDHYENGAIEEYDNSDSSYMDDEEDENDDNDDGSDSGNSY
jgi:hypothetical protein